MTLITMPVQTEQTYRTNAEMEYALYHLMYQFRQMNYKYGLMVSEQIDTWYADRNKKLNEYEYRVISLANTIRL